MVRVQLLKFSLMMTWDGTQLDINAPGVQLIKCLRASGKNYL